MTRSPNLPPQPQPDNGSIFRVGNIDLTREVVVNDIRLLEWTPTRSDEVLAKHAGWSSLPHGYDESTKKSYLELPAGTRSASSVLAGVEAWTGEKQEIIDFINYYVASTSKDFDGGVDVNLSLDTVAVTKDRQLFVVPPHNLKTDRNDIGEMLNALLVDMQDVMGQDPYQKDLVYRALSGFQVLHVEPGREN